MSDRKIIYLDDAIDAICKACQYDTDDYADCPDRAPSSLFCDYMNALRQLPSAQPEIIRCKGCKLFGQPQCLMCFDGYDWTEPDGYCYMAERREE